MKVIDQSNTNLVAQRLAVLQLADELGNVAEACRRSGMDRTSFYQWRRRFQTHGLGGLINLPPVHLTHPQTIAPQVEKSIISASIEHPNCGCVKLETILKQKGVIVSSPTIQKVLIRHNLGQRQQRWLHIEEKHLAEKSMLTPDQIWQIEKYNPCFRERHRVVDQPGKLLVQDMFPVGNISGVGRVSLHAVVDTYGSFAFGFFHTGSKAACAVAVLHSDVLPFYRALNIPVTAILTDCRRDFYGNRNHSYHQYLVLNGIEHHKASIGNGFVERFKQAVVTEFFRGKFPQNNYAAVDELQKDFDEWLYYYNYERAHRGYPNMGKRPIDIIESYLDSVQSKEVAGLINYNQLSRLIRYKSGYLPSDGSMPILPYNNRNDLI